MDAQFDVFIVIDTIISIQGEERPALGESMLFLPVALSLDVLAL